MPADTGAGEKTEEPTPKKRQDAREEGQVAFSPDLNSSGLLIAGFCALAVLAPWLWSVLAGLLRRCLDDRLATPIVDGRDVTALFGQAAPVGWYLLPFLATMFATGVALSVIQVGWHPTLKPLVPKFDRLNPLTGLQRLFSARGLMRTLTSVLKLTLVGFVAWRVIAADFTPQLTIGPDLGQRLGVECSALFWLGMKLCLVVAVLGIADWLFQRWQHGRDLMMTKQEVREEFKQSEGDPLIKGKIRQIQRDMAQKRMMQEVPKADVVITNPTHVAVALKYEQGTSAAPVVIAKGYDEVAQRIKALAIEHGITMVENIPLARALAKEVAIGRQIPVRWYQAVAEVLSLVYKLKKAEPVRDAAPAA